LRATNVIAGQISRCNVPAWRTRPRTQAYRRSATRNDSRHSARCRCDRQRIGNSTQRRVVGGGVTRAQPARADGKPG
jgi:hypothetical protein